MRKFTLLFAAMMLANVAMAEIVVEKLWESTTDIPLAGSSKQGVGYDGTIYAQDLTASKIYAYSESEGAVSRTEYAASDVGAGFAVDNAGNLAVRVGYFATGTPAGLKIYKKGETTPIAITFALPKSGRTDYNSASGDFFSAEGGYVYFYSTGQTDINFVKICNGGAEAEDVTVGVLGIECTAGTATSYVMPVSPTKLACQIRSAPWQVLKEGSATAANMPGVKLSTLGGCAFTIKDKDGAEKEMWVYNCGSTHYNSEFKVRNMTDGADLATFQIGDGAATNTAYANWTTASKIDDHSYYIHQYCPGVGAALYKIKDDAVEIGVGLDKEEISAVRLHETMGGVRIDFAGEAMLQVYNVNGMLINEAKAYDGHEFELQTGVYIIRVNGKAHKFVK